MPAFEPFAGLRYDSARVDMAMVTSPPYDVISGPERERLARRHSANAVRIELPEADHRAGLDRYGNAAALLASWQSSGTLVRDLFPSLYAYRMTSTEGRTTTGVIGALAIDGNGADILPHEETLPKPKSDRLDLLRATRANLSPIWGLSLTSGLTETFAPSGPAATEVVDDDGVHHQLWVIDDTSTIEAVRAAVASSPVVIADGHHRYETALTYRKEQIADGGDVDGTGLVMAFVVELSDDQLSVGPVHRSLSGLPDGLDLVDAFASWFDVTGMGEVGERTVATLGESGALALVMPSGAWLLSPKDGTAEAAGSSLDSSMTALVFAELPDHELRFCHTWEEAAEAIALERAQAVVLLRPVTVDRIAEWARTGMRMPPKTTYFHPKPRSGMVYRTLHP
jgi:uncharacterized protein (DUF1015 family)